MASKVERASDAEGLLKLALQVNPRLPGAYEALAEVYMPQARYAEARQALDAELALRPPSQTNALLLRGLLAYWVDGDLATAEGDLRAAAVQVPARPAPVQALADVLEDAGSADAGVWAQKAAQLAAHQPVADDTLGRDYEALGLWGLAIREFRYLAEHDPVGNLDLGELELESGGTFQDGLARLHSAVGAIPNQETFRLALAHAEVQAGETAAAQRDMAAARQMDPAVS